MRDNQSSRPARRWITALLTGAMVLSLIPAAAAAELSSAATELYDAASDAVQQARESQYVEADWKFGSEGVQSGTIAGGDLVLEDQSGNGNDLEMRLFAGGSETQDASAADWTQYLSFSEDSMTGEGSSMIAPSAKYRPTRMAATRGMPTGQKYFCFSKRKKKSKKGMKSWMKKTAMSMSKHPVVAVKDGQRL